MIRPFEPADMEPVLKIWLDASVQSHDFIPQEYWISKQKDMREIYLPSAENFVCDTKSVVAGFASISQNVLAALFVAPSIQGRGIGTQLLDQAKEMRKKLFLNVYKENKKSIAFYEKNGFAWLREQTDELTGHPEIVMIWKEMKGRI